MRRRLSESRSELVVLVVLLLVGLLMHRLIWWLPIFLTVPLVLAYTIKQSFSYLVVLAVMAELFSSLPVAIVSSAILFPWFVKKLFRKLEVDVSVRFLMLVLVTVFIQLTIIFAGDIVFTRSVYDWFQAFPWIRIVTVSLLSSPVVFGVIVFTHYNKR